jgi:hypothetical protein
VGEPILSRHVGWQWSFTLRNGAAGTETQFKKGFENGFAKASLLTSSERGRVGMFSVAEVHHVMAVGLGQLRRVNVECRRGYPAVSQQLRPVARPAPQPPRGVTPCRHHQPGSAAYLARRYITYYRRPPSFQGINAHWLVGTYPAPTSTTPLGEELWIVVIASSLGTALTPTPKSPTLSTLWGW